MPTTNNILVTEVLNTGSELTEAVLETTFQSVADALTAAAVTTQTGSLVLTAKCNRVTTVAASGDAVSIGVPAIAGMSIVIRNDAASNAMNVYPIIGGTDKINALSANAAYSMAAGGGSLTFRCYTTGTWITG